MNPKPVEEDIDRKPSGKLEGKVAIITGGDSGIGRSVALLFAKEGADISIVYLEEHKDAQETQRAKRRTQIAFSAVDNRAPAQHLFLIKLISLGRLPECQNPAETERKRKFT
jgi:hypothetical protein